MIIASMVSTDSIVSSRLGAPRLTVPSADILAGQAVYLAPMTVDDDLLPTTTVAIRLTDFNQTAGWLVGELSLEELWRMVDSIRVAEEGLRWSSRRTGCSSLTASPMSLERFPIDVNRSVADVVESMRSLADTAGLSLEARLTPESLYIDGDLFALGRVYRNLILNAIEATSPGGRSRWPPKNTAHGLGSACPTPGQEFRPTARRRSSRTSRPRNAAVSASASRFRARLSHSYPARSRSLARSAPGRRSPWSSRRRRRDPSPSPPPAKLA